MEGRRGRPAASLPRRHEHDRERLERLCRYAVRPPFALHRLSQGEDGQLVYRMKRPRGGSLFLLLEPDELLARLATLVPPPRIHSVRYHGVFVPNSRARARVPWADLLKKVFAVEVLSCPDCSGRLRIIAFIADDAVARRILLHLGLDSRGPPVARAEAPPDFSELGPSYDGADPLCAD